MAPDLPNLIQNVCSRKVKVEILEGVFLYDLIEIGINLEKELLDCEVWGGGG